MTGGLAAWRAAIPGLRSLSMFGSCLSPSTRAAGSIPDLFAVVDDVPAAARAAGAGRVAAALARLLPPATVALHDTTGAGAGLPVAKLNLIEPRALARAVGLARGGHLPDLTVAGRLSKRVVVLHARDVTAARELAAALEAAAGAVVTRAFRDLPRRLSVAAFARRCFALSYRGEVRPERAAHIAARFDAFAVFYEERFGNLAAALCPPGVAVIPPLPGASGGAIEDRRPRLTRLLERLKLAALLLGSRARSVLRWPRAMLLYRGWPRYLAGKLRRSLTFSPSIQASHATQTNEPSRR